MMAMARMMLMMILISHMAKEDEHGISFKRMNESRLCYFYKNTNVFLTFKVQDTWISRKRATFPLQWSNSLFNSPPTQKPCESRDNWLVMLRDMLPKTRLPQSINFIFQHLRQTPTFCLMPLESVHWFVTFSYGWPPLKTFGHKGGYQKSIKIFSFTSSNYGVSVQLRISL